MEVSIGLLVLLVEMIQGFQIHGPSGPLVAQLGASVLLPCFVETPLPLGELELEWRRTDSDALVHLFQEGEVRTESQDHAYSGRAHFFTVEISQGNYSLFLNNVSQEDAGIYSCKVYSDTEAHHITVNLKSVEYLVVVGAVAVAVTVGEEAVLSCSVESHLPPEKLEEIAWRRTENEILVLLYQHGEALPNSTHERYQGRAEFFMSEIPKGNFSLRLKDIRPEDKGEYICEAHSGHLSANSMVILQDLGLSSLQYLGFICCVASFVISSVAVGHFVKRGRHHASGVHFLLFFSPNVLLFSGFILWGSAGGVFSEAAACSVVSLTRISLLLGITPYLKGGSLQRLMRALSVTVEHTVIAVVVYLDALNKRLKWMSLGMFATSYHDKMKLCVFFGAIIFLSVCGLCTDIESAYHLPCMLPRSVPGPNSQVDPSKQVFTFVLLEISSFAQMLFLTFKTKAFSSGLRISFLWIAPLMIITVVLIRRLVRKRLQHRGRVCWTVTMAVWMPVHFVIIICILGHLQDATEAISPGESAGLLCAFGVLKMLSNMSLSKHPDGIPALPQSILYMFGAAGLNIVNSLGLATKLLTLGRGHHNVPDLRLITLPFECLFLFGWFTLQIHDYWTHKIRRECNSEVQGDLRQDTSDSHEMDAVAIPFVHTSDPKEKPV